MLKTKHIATLAAVLLIGACTEDPDIANTQPTKKTTVTVMPYSASFFEAEEMPTRAGLPEGYKTFRTLYPKTLPHHSTIGLFVTPTNTTVGENVISINEQDKWTGQLNLTNGTQYIYGFMPNEEAQRATITAKDGNFANGATIQINGLNTLTSADVCVVVGIAKGTQGTSIEQTDFNLGCFSYESDGSNNQYVYILLDHLFAGLHFKVHIDTKYAELRTIKIKEMYLKTAQKISKTINLTVPLTANTTGQNPIGEVTYVNVSSSGDSGYDYAEIQLFPNENTQEEYRTNGYPVPVQTTEDFLSCFAPLTCREFVLKTTYDVYDRKGNLIRQNCTAENKITSRHTAGFQDLKRGDIYTIDLKVQPTYIYVLSDPDLDNPTFTVE